ncbi:DedA family protein [Calidifontibacter sp. DB0510]|uniref:DedA family protein n=1 Tax=Metallococcus carri TaxID=1656884 RepID=A0A967B3J6_9MICO|nr:DedA family protein [Metallococcus carri]NHN56620.1 DedA family protein [Metallococcus carri]NOP38919.1 DedA family protein [Calidifontibacter sp. DB2511S]
MNIDHLLQTIPADAVYGLVGLVVGIESLGIPLPGEVVLVAASVLSSRGGSQLTPHGIAIGAILGAVIGDSIGYAIGRRYGDRLFRLLARRFPRHVNDDVVAYAEHVFQRYGVLAVFFGRFVALLRIFAGPLSGMLRLSYPKFLAANVLGAICWAGGTTYAVYYAGRAAEAYLKNFSYAGLALAVILGILASTVLRRRLERNVEAFAASRRAEKDNPSTAPA